MLFQFHEREAGEDLSPQRGRDSQNFTYRGPTIYQIARWWARPSSTSKKRM